MFADTGLLDHWALRLTPSGLASSGICQVSDNGLTAHCDIGRGRATVIADADFLNVDAPQAKGLDVLMIQLARLETR